MSDLVGNHEDWFSSVVAQLFCTKMTQSLKFRIGGPGIDAII